MLTEGTKLFPKWSFSFPTKGWLKANTAKLSIDIEVTMVLVAEKSISHGEIYAPNEARIPKEAANPTKSTKRITHA